MFRVGLILLALILATPGQFAVAVPVKSCSADTNKTMKKGEKTYTCGSCEICKTTDCSLGDPPVCTITTTRSCADCEETTNQSRTGRLPLTTDFGVFDPGTRPPRRAPVEAAPQGGQVAQ